MRKAVMGQEESDGLRQRRVLARILAEDLRKARGSQEHWGSPRVSLLASGTPTDVDSEPDYTWRGSDGDTT